MQLDPSNPVKYTQYQKFTPQQQKEYYEAIRADLLASGLVREEEKES